MANSDYTRNAVLNWAVGRSGTIVDPAPTTRVIKCWTAMPTTAGSGGVQAPTESTYTINPVNDFGTAASSGSISNSGIITFTTATENWGTIVGITIEDASGSGNQIRRIESSAGVVVNTGDTLTIPIGNLILTLT